MKNSNALEKLNLLIKDEDVWLSSMDLAEISGNIHKNVMRDIREDIENGLNSILRNLRTWLKFEPGSQETLIESLSSLQRNLKESGMNNVYVQSILDIKIKEETRLTKGGKFSHYLLNREASLIVLSRYSPEIRILISNLFFKSVDLMKSKGYVVNDVDDMYRATEEEFKSNADMFLDDLREDGVLSDFSAFHLLDVLMRKIPEELNEYFCDNFPLYKRIRRQVFEKGDTGFTIENNVKSTIGKNIKNN